MPNYETIAGKSGITGIHPFSQSLQKRLMKIYSIGGYCRGAVTEWLKLKKKGGFKSLVMFEEDEEEKKVETSSLLSKKKKVILKSVSNQKEYKEDPTNIEVTAKELETVGLVYKIGESKKVKKGFKEDALVIAEHVASTESRFFVLGLHGDTAHAVGIVRESNSNHDKFRFFDPNEGEFEVTGPIGMLAMLVFLEAISYSGKYTSSYRLYAFK